MCEMREPKIGYPATTLLGSNRRMESMRVNKVALALPLWRGDGVKLSELVGSPTWPPELHGSDRLQ